MSFEWTYQLGSTESSYFIYCGYFGIFPDWVTIQTGDSPAVVQEKYKNRTEVYNSSENSIGFKLKDFRPADAGVMGCLLEYQGDTMYSNAYILELNSKSKQVHI